MMGQKLELARLVAYVFQTSGRRRISEEDWVRVLSFERAWLAPGKAKKAAAAARGLGLLRNAGDRDFEMGLEAEGLQLPIDYRPDVARLEAEPGAAAPSATPQALPLFRRIAQAIAQGTNQSEAEVIGRINATQAGLGGLLSGEVAALYYGALNKVDLSMFFDEAERSRQPLSHVHK